MQLFYSNEMNRVEEERLQAERERFAERERMAREEYEKSVANINNLLATQQNFASGGGRASKASG